MYSNTVPSDKPDKAVTAQCLQSTIPDALRQYPHWVVWKYLPRSTDAKISKVPFCPHGSREQKAQVNRPKSWGSFQQSLSAYLNGTYDGIGFVFGDDPFCGVDCDQCVDTNGSLLPWASEIIRRIDSYGEWSPSRHGIHLIAQATLPLAGMRRGNVEMYHKGRFFTVSGLHLAQTPLAIETRQAVIESLYREYTHQAQQKQEHHLPLPMKEEAIAPRRNIGPSTSSASSWTDAELLARAMNVHSQRGAEFARLWHGNKGKYIHAHGEHQGEIDDSRADLALCGMLAFWTGKDALRMDRLFRQSGLMRPKWDEPARAGQTYGQGTIALALARCSNTYTPGWKPRHTPKSGKKGAWR